MTDVVIIGGGPAGSVLGSYLSRAGISNVILERANHPRPHVGESLVTSTTRVFEDIGFLQTMEREGFTKKYGAAWHAKAGRGEFTIRFGEFPQPGINQEYTYHVDRSKFDLLLLKHAESVGSSIYQGVGVNEVVFDDNDFARGVRFSVAGKDYELPAKFVVDASGRNSILGTQRHLRQKDPIFNQFAVHGWFENVHRGTTESADYIHIYFIPAERGWVWQIPINDKVTSIGVVAEKEVFKQSRQRREDYFWDHIRSSPDLAAAMAAAKPVNELRSEADYSYTMSRFVGNGWMLVGDAARFVDPIFSSGVSIACESAKFASEAIAGAFAAEDVSETALLGYESKLKGGVTIWYEFIRLYYKLMHLFTYFIDSKEHRLQILQLLQGEVYDRESAPVLDAMRKMIVTVEETPGHLWAKELTDIEVN
jgi:flavin-dependent dehydrogenase